MSDGDNENASAGKPGEGRVAPLGWDQHGNPILYPPEAVGFRVRRFTNARGGAPEVVYHDGIPLLLDLDTSIDDLREVVGGIGGKYRLEAVDERALLLEQVPHAYVVLASSTAAPPSSGADSLTRVLDTVERLARANAEAIDKLTSQMGSVLEASSHLVSAADSAGMTRREPPTPTAVQVLAPLTPVVEGAPGAPIDASGSATFWKAFADGLAPQLPAILAGLAQLVTAKVATGNAAPGQPAGEGGL